MSTNRVAEDIAFGLHIVGADGKCVAQTPETDRRIVACVNACAGIPTEKLSDISHVLSHRVGALIDLVKHRDELLAALQELADRVERIVLDDESTPDTSSTRAAIAKALGEPR